MGAPMATVTINLGALDKLTEAAATKGVLKAAEWGSAQTKANLSLPGTGRTYEFEFRTINGRSIPMRNRPRPGGPHTASAPGSPPAVDLGVLREGVLPDTQVRYDGDAIVSRVVSRMEYSLHLEKGAERMAPRPFLSLLGTDHQDGLRAAFVLGAKEAS